MLIYDVAPARGLRRQNRLDACLGIGRTHKLDESWCLLRDSINLQASVETSLDAAHMSARATIWCANFFLGRFYFFLG